MFPRPLLASEFLIRIVSTIREEHRLWKQKMPLSTRRSFTGRTPCGLFGTIGLIAVRS
jgi:hypothetical protein